MADSDSFLRVSSMTSSVPKITKGAHRYAFWRGPDGNLNKKDPDKYCPTELLAECGRETKVNQDNSVSWTPHFDQIAVGLRLAFAIFIKDEPLNDHDAWTIAKNSLVNACRSAGGGAPIDNARFLEIADTLAHEFARRPLRKYTLVATLSIKTLPRKSIHINGCTIRPLSSRGKFKAPQVLVGLSQESLFRRHLEKSSYARVKVETTGRSENESALKAIDSLNLLRAYWTFPTVFRRWTHHFGPGQLAKALAVVHLGPFQTLHFPSGECVADSFWRDTDPQEDQNLFSPPVPWSELDNLRRRAMRRSVLLPYRRSMEHLLLRYIAALDQRDHDVSFLQMWTLLEYITGTIGGKYDETIERAVCFVTPRGLGRQLLQCVRIQRNRYVHAAHSTIEPDQAAHLLKMFLELHLNILQWNAYRIASLDEYAKILALPCDIATLQTQKKRLSIAIRLHAAAVRKRTKAEPKGSKPSRRGQAENSWAKPKGSG
jgi:hypothetical protein